MPEESRSQPEPTGNSTWQLTKLICLGVVAASVLACVLLAAMRSSGLVGVTVTALDPDAEPRDHRIPFFKRNEALPDYDLVVHLTDGGRRRLGTKPNTSAAEGLEWVLNDPISVADISGIRLYDEDKFVSDALVEAQVTGDSITVGNYRFDFKAERSLAVGVESFFGTPIGKAIAGGFFVAVLLIVLSVFAV